MFFLLIQLFQRDGNIFTVLDGNGSTCGPFGDACSPQAGSQSHSVRQGRLGSGGQRGVIRTRHSSFFGANSNFAAGGIAAISSKDESDSSSSALSGNSRGGSRVFVVHSSKDMSFSGFGSGVVYYKAFPRQIKVSANNGFGGFNSKTHNVNFSGAKGIGMMHTYASSGNGMLVRGIWESSGTSSSHAVEFSGVLKKGTLTVSHLRAAHGYIDTNHLSARDINWLQWGKSDLRSSLGSRGLQVSTSTASQKVFGSATLHGATGKVGVVSGSGTNWKSYLASTHPPSASSNIGGGATASGNSWHAYLSGSHQAPSRAVGDLKKSLVTTTNGSAGVAILHSGSAGLLTSGSAAHASVVTTHASGAATAGHTSTGAAASSTSSGPSATSHDDWWDHGVKSKFLLNYSAPQSVTAAAAVEIARSAALHGTSLDVGSGLHSGRSDDLDCRGICYYAPQPMTQSTIAVYHSK